MYRILLAWNDKEDKDTLALRETEEEARSVLIWTIRDLQRTRGMYVEPTTAVDVYDIYTRHWDTLTHKGRVSLVKNQT